MIIQLTEPNNYFDEAMKLYQQEFDEDIREDVNVFKESFRLPNERYYFLCYLINDHVAGFITFHYEPAYRIGYIVYLVVDPRYRGYSIAAQLMHEAERVMDQTHYIMLECEKDASGHSPLDAFYKKFGFKAADFNYVQPGLHGGPPVPMNLYVKGAHDDKLIASVSHIYKVKYGQTNHIDLSLLEQYISAMTQ